MTTEHEVLDQDRKPQPHAKRHRWGFKDVIPGAPFARSIATQNHDITCYDCGLVIPGPVYLEMFKKLRPYQNLPIKEYMEKQEQLLEIIALEYEPDPPEGGQT